MKTFEELHCRQKAKDLAITLYVHCKDMEEWVLKDSICTSCFDIGTSIASGQWLNVKENSLHLWRGKEASAKLRSLLHIAKELDYVNDNTFNEFYNEALDVSKMISWLIKALKQPVKQDKPAK